MMRWAAWVRSRSEDTMNGAPSQPLAVALLTAVVVVSVALADGHAAKIRKNTVKSELPPGELTDFALGDKAIWKFKKLGEVSIEVTGVKRGVVSRRRADGCSYDIFRGVWAAPATKWKNCYGSSGTAKVARKGKSKLFPLKVGNSAKFSVQGKSKRGGKVSKWATTRRCKVKGTANVAVPAGRFDAYRIDCSDDWNSYRYYYSPELRFPILFSQKPRKGKSGRRTHTELISLEPANAPASSAQGKRKASQAAVARKKGIATEQEFRDLVAGRKMSNKHGYSVLHEDGSLSGMFGERRLTGTWSWEGKFFCRIAKLGNKNLGLDCQAVAVSGDKVTFTRKRGKGKKVTYRLQAPEG